jgi:hypothetical protein
MPALSFHSGKVWTMALCFVLIFSFKCITSPQAGQPDESIQSLISAAGNTSHESERLALLKQLRAQPDLPETLSDDLDKLIPFIKKWTGSHIMAFWMNDATAKENLREKIWALREIDLGLAPSSPLYPFTWLYRGRMMAWSIQQFGGVIFNDPPVRRRFFDEARGFFERYVEVFPDNQVAWMYLGRSTRAEKHYSTAPGAPEWAVYQREGLERLTDIAHWWIDNRQRETGEYGGLWNDDCEMWRTWMAVLVGFDDPKIIKAQKKLSHALLSQPHLRDGYTNQMWDVEHTAEDTTDTLLPMMYIEPDNPEWTSHALQLSRLMKETWTGINKKGHSQFKSNYFTAQEVLTDPLQAYDTPYHVRAIQPALLYWLRTGDSRLTPLFTEWLDTWVNAAQSTEGGKPRGILPAGIHWPSGSCLGTTGKWWDPVGADKEEAYRVHPWPKAQTYLLGTLLIAWHVTGNDRYLQPLRDQAELLRHTEADRNAPEGSAEWAASYIRGQIDEPAVAHHLLTGSTEFYRLVKKTRNPYLLLRLKGQHKPIRKRFHDIAQSLRYNYEGATSECPYTDRIFYFHRFFKKDYFFPGVSVPIISRSPGQNWLYVTTTGDTIRSTAVVLAAVRWLTPPRDIAALVTSAGRKEFTSELFHFGPEPRSMGAEFHLLKPGIYKWNLTALQPEKETVAQGKISISEGQKRLNFVLPSSLFCQLAIRPASQK